MRYQAQKRSRIKHTFIGMTTYESIWWDDDAKKWSEKYDEMKRFSSHCDCNSVRAFRRRLKKCPKSVEFILVSRWKGYDVYGKNTTKSK
jgi:hypothetical protein